MIELEIIRADGTREAGRAELSLSERGSIVVSDLRTLDGAPLVLEPNASVSIALDDLRAAR